MAKTILILGGGVGGLVAANRLRSWVPKSWRVVVIDREASFVFAPSFLWLMTGGRTAAKISRPLAGLQRKGIEMIRGEIERIDPARREVTAAGRTLSGDFLVIALGAESMPEAVPGLEQAGHNFYTLSGAEAFRAAFGRFTEGRILILTAAPAYKCPAAPYEAAMLIEHACRRRGIRDRVQIDLYTAEPLPMGVAGPAVSSAVRQMVEAKGVTYHPEHGIASAAPSAGHLTFANEIEAAYDLLAYVPVHRVPRVVREADLVSESGWIPVDRHTLETKFERVYALGDVTSIPLRIGKPLPKAGVFAHGEAEVVARNIARAITGRGEETRFDGAGECFIETGDGKAGIGKGDFYAEPAPQVRIRPPARRWHAAKILFEKHFLWRWL